MTKSVGQWDVFGLELMGPADGNPFVDVTFGATFSCDGRSIRVSGFYDGNANGSGGPVDGANHGVYRVRFMPDVQGRWQYVTFSNEPQLDARSGSFQCVQPRDGVHGPVRVANRFHFAHADGTPHYSIGTTCYAWTHQGDQMEEKTLAALADGPFNKIRMCVFPKDYTFSRNEPPRHAFDKRADGSWNTACFNVDYFRHFEKRIGQLADLNIEADIILFHPYDRWGYSKMDALSDDRYIRYITARLAAFRNVWWSMANEYELMRSKTVEDWDRMGRLVRDCDPYGRPISIHNCNTFYDHSRPWISHCSVQNVHLERIKDWRDQYKKPVVIDECCYEGDLEFPWGNIPAAEMVRRFWMGICRGGYVGHGETYRHPQDILWWSKGGELRGQSAPRIAFLRKIMEEGPPQGLEPATQPPLHTWSHVCCAGVHPSYFLAYLDMHAPSEIGLTLPQGNTYRVEVLDTWEMTVKVLAEAASGVARLPMPGKSCQALRIRKCE